MDCRNNPCDFAVDLRGQRTSGRCRCWDSLPKMDPETRVAVRRTAAELRTALATERAARESAEQLAVWAVLKGALIHVGKLTWMRDIDETDDDDEYRVGSTECDGTDAGILAALRRAKGGE